MLFVLFRIVEVLLNILWWIIVIQAVMSWLIAFNIINTWNDTVRSVWNALQKMTDPLYRPIRRIMPDFGGLDLSPLVVLLIIYILMTIVLPYIYNLLAGGVVA
ncbi:MAG: YggT family protein [Sphingomonas bacterium]|uniref:YggT family protein n=1 Tax=Sphingomonas bacterium TaxID=1895847 RepID=UPI002626EBE8|nr:YggT family protein [Sphingomonas bacterium]MDB5711832.1 YggT family protein [Sphingomonas bacterium]